MNRNTAFSFMVPYIISILITALLSIFLTVSLVLSYEPDYGINKILIICAFLLISSVIIVHFSRIIDSKHLSIEYTASAKMVRQSWFINRERYFDANREEFNRLRFGFSLAAIAVSYTPALYTLFFGNDSNIRSIFLATILFSIFSFSRQLYMPTNIFKYTIILRLEHKIIFCLLLALVVLPSYGVAFHSDDFFISHKVASHPIAIFATATLLHFISDIIGYVFAGTGLEIRKPNTMDHMEK